MYSLTSPVQYNARFCQKERGRKGIQIENEEFKLCLFSDDIILYIFKPKDATQRPLHLRNEFRKAS